VAVTWEELEAKVKACRRCTLSATCTQKVFGKGAHEARVVVVGEAPRAQDDMYGEPFHDKIGLFLRKTLANTGFVKGDVFLCTLMKCRPPKNREPYPQEILACVGYLLDQIELIHPDVVVTLGQVALKALVPKGKARVGSVRGDFIKAHGYLLVPTWNPAYVLGSKSYLRVKEFQKDLKRVHEKVFDPAGESLLSRMT